GGLTIDLVDDEVTVDGKVVSLTPSEFKILGLLASSPGATLSRRQIMEHLWGSTHIGDEHTCEVHVSTLRRKIERDPSPPRGRAPRSPAPGAAPTCGGSPSARSAAASRCPRGAGRPTCGRARTAP